VVVNEGVFLLASSVVQRPRPAVVRLDQAPFTSSYPSGHVGATTALYVSLALLALRLGQRWLGRAVAMVCVLVPMAVMFSRLYRGMHHPTDVAVGMVSGLVCAWLAHSWYLHTRTAPVRSVRTHDGSAGGALGSSRTDAPPERDSPVE
jgi:membrane-associated phospholipid phosphatase